MKKGIILATFVLVMGTLCMACGGGGDDDDDGILGCPDIEGAYTVDKLLFTAVCDGLTIDLGDINISLASTLEITQPLCTLVATEEDGTITIPYIGESHGDDSFDLSLDLDNPDIPPISLELREGPVVIPCDFNPSSISWEGDVENHNLSGEIAYDLEGSGLPCPDSCTINMTFTAVKQ
jgi:hypothetical protein